MKRRDQRDTAFAFGDEFRAVAKAPAFRRERVAVGVECRYGGLRADRA